MVGCYSEGSALPGPDSEAGRKIAARAREARRAAALAGVEAAGGVDLLDVAELLVDEDPVMVARALGWERIEPGEVYPPLAFRPPGQPVLGAFDRALQAETERVQTEVLADVLRQTYAPAIAEQLNRPMLFSSYREPTPWERRWFRLTRRPRRIAWRLAETWGVLRHGLPEADF